MAAPINTYSSTVELNLGQVPQVDDPVLYTALLDIHNALEAILTASDGDYAEFLAFLAKYRKVVVTSAANYLVTETDGTILVDASSNDVTVTLPAASAVSGARYNVKRIDTSSFTALLLGDGGEEIDGEVGGWTLDYLDNIPVKSADTKWWIE